MIVVDTSGILVLKDESQPEHSAAADLIEGSEEDLLLSPFVLAEAGYMLASRLGQGAANELLDEVVSGAYDLVDFDAGAVASAKGILDRYDDMNIGLTDASLVVIAARFETTRLLTLDERHFRTVAPLWGAPAFTLLPADASTP
jgi:predicted nucleic acid-binding protein